MNVDTVTHYLQLASAGLGAAYAASLLLNAFQPVIAPRFPRAAAVLAGLGGHVGEARRGLAEASEALKAIEGK